MRSEARCWVVTEPGAGASGSAAFTGATTGAGARVGAETGATTGAGAAIGLTTGAGAAIGFKMGATVGATVGGIVGGTVGATVGGLRAGGFGSSAMEPPEAPGTGGAALSAEPPRRSKGNRDSAEGNHRSEEDQQQ